MIVTKKWIIENYNKYKAMIFDNKLPEIGFDSKRFIKFQVCTNNSSKRLGCFKIVVTRPLGLIDYSIIISNYYDRTEKEFLTTLIHEMIHCYITYNNIKDTSSHGKYFLYMAESINKKYDFNIKPKSHIDFSDVRNKNKEYYILALKLNNGKCYISSLSKNYKEVLFYKAKNLTSKSFAKLYKTNDVTFDSYTKVRTFKATPKSTNTFNDIVDKLEKNAIIIAE